MPELYSTRELVEILIALSLPISVLLVGVFTLWLANKKRNDDLFDRRFDLYKRILQLSSWMVGTKYITSRNYPIKIEDNRAYFDDDKDIDWAMLSHLPEETLFLFDYEISRQVQSMAQAASLFHLDPLKAKENRVILHTNIYPTIVRLEKYLLINDDWPSEYFPTFFHLKKIVLRGMTTKILKTSKEIKKELEDEEEDNFNNSIVIKLLKEKTAFLTKGSCKPR